MKKRIKMIWKYSNSQYLSKKKKKKSIPRVQYFDTVQKRSHANYSPKTDQLRSRKACEQCVGMVTHPTYLASRKKANN